MVAIAAVPDVRANVFFYESQYTEKAKVVHWMGLPLEQHYYWPFSAAPEDFVTSVDLD